MLILLIFLLAIGYAQQLEQIHRNGYCSMYNQSPTGSPIFFNQPAPSVHSNSSLIQKISDLCGSSSPLLSPSPSNNNNTQLCCSDAQMDTLKKKIGIAAQLLSTCTACFSNFVSFWCQFTCSPRQSQFLDVQKLSRDSKYVDTLSFYVSPGFYDTFYRSCQDVKFNADNSRALSFLAAGATDGLSLLRVMGRRAPGLNPMQINFPAPDDTVPVNMTRFDMHAYECNDPQQKCSCSDCFKSCSAEYPPDLHLNQCRIGGDGDGWECTAFFGTLVYVFLVLTAMGYYLMPRLIRWYVLRGRGRGDSGVLLVQSDDLEVSTPSGGGGEEDSILSIPDEKELSNNNELAAQKYSWFVDEFFQKVFYRLGLFSASNPGHVIAGAALVLLILATGWSLFEVETNPLRLWVDPSSKVLHEKEYFDTNFAPFYRITQVVVTTSYDEPILKWATLNATWDIQDVVENVVVDGMRYRDICFKPTDGACATQSFRGWYQDDRRKFNSDSGVSGSRKPLETLFECISSPGKESCLAPSLQPLDPKLVLGGITAFNTTDWSKSVALVLTFLVNNSVDPEYITKVSKWEEAVEKRLLDLQVPGLKFSFSTESSVERELSRDTYSDVDTIILSYFIMFLYASFALGKMKFDSSFFIGSRFLLGTGGIIIVILSAIASVGLLSFFRLKATLIIAEVIPFLVLAVGVDNIFIIVNAFDRITRDSDESEPAENRIALAMKTVGPSILLSSLCEVLAFALGSMVSMPAVSIFSIYASISVLFNFLLQITCFIAFLSMDAKRQESGRYDCLPFLKARSRGYTAIDQDEIFNKPGKNNESLLEYAFSKYYAPLLLKPLTKKIVIAVFVTLFVFLGLNNLHNVEFGLDQRLALPRDSYLVDYFDSIENYLEVGPPLYFVFKGKNPDAGNSSTGLDLFSVTDQRKICGKFLDCDEMSVANLLELEYRKNEKKRGSSPLASPTSIWLDDFVIYLNNPGIPCCSMGQCFKEPPEEGDEDMEEDNYPNHITSCACWKWRDMFPSIARESGGGNYSSIFQNHIGPVDKLDDFGLPDNRDRLMKSLKIWLDASPKLGLCALAGKAAYGTSLSIKTDSQGHDYVNSFVLRTYHQTLRTQADFIEAYKQAKHISKVIMEKSLKTDAKDESEIETVFPYSVFYVYFEQYEQIVSMAIRIIISALFGAAVIIFVLTGSLMAVFSVVLTVLMVIVDLVGFMALWHVSFNAVSTVNLVIAVGISLEFCVHVARATVMDQSVEKAIAEIGSSVFSGITVTKLLGIFILAFARSKIFEVFYFRMYLGIVLFGAAHGLILLPVILDIMLKIKNRKRVC